MRKMRDVNGLWRKLCTDLLIVIFTGLDSLDQLAFRGVCKAWRSAALAAPEEHVKQLWLMYKQKLRSITDSSRDSFCFVNYSFSSSNDIIRPVCTWKLPILRGCSILTAKHGWLLVGRQCFMDVVETFFYDPFSRKAINLPTFSKPSCFSGYDLGENRLQSRFDFTGSPTSPECMVVAVFYEEGLNRLVTTTCRRGQATWAPLVVYWSVKFVWLYASLMVFDQGSFYCVDWSSRKIGKVLAFHPETNTIKSFSGHPRQTEENRFKTGCEVVLCDLVDPAASMDLVKRLGGEEVLLKWQYRLQQERQRVKMWRKMPKVLWSNTLQLGEIELGYPVTYQPFLHKEEGQLLVLWHVPTLHRKDLVWINKRILVPPQEQDHDLQWVTSKNS